MKLFKPQIRFSFKHKKLIYAAFFAVMIFSAGLILPIQTVRAKCVPTEGGIILNVPIPGVGTEVRDEAGQVCGYEIKPGKSGDKESPPQLVTYIKGMYKFFVGIAGILAVFMIMFGGVQWLFSGGNAGKITSAKETIFGAVIGLVLALGSYTLLVTINPRLVNLTFNLGTVAPYKDCYKDDDSLKAPEDIPCGLVCQPKAGKGGSTVIGACEFCALSTRDCGLSKYGESGTKNNGDCVYANCKNDNACVYLSAYNSNYTTDITDYQPHCSEEIKNITATLDPPYNTEVTTNCILSSGILGGRAAGSGGAAGALTNILEADKKCGEIWTEYKGPNEWKCVVGTLCDFNQTCVIDLSQGYQAIILDDNDTPLEHRKNYHFGGAQCVNSTNL